MLGHQQALAEEVSRGGGYVFVQQYMYIHYVRLPTCASKAIVHVWFLLKHVHTKHTQTYIYILSQKQVIILIILPLQSDSLLYKHFAKYIYIYQM